MAASNIINPYEQIWKTRDLRALETPVEIDNKLPEWRRGLGAFGKEMQATGYGLVGLGAQGVENLIGENAVTSGLTDWGIEGYNKAIQESQTGLNAPSVARVEDIKNASDAMDWAGYQLGKGIPMLGTLALSGGIGGAIARIGANQGVKALAKSAVGDLVKKTVATKAIQAAEGQVVTQAMKQAAATALRDTFAKGAIAGGFTGSFGLEGGLAFGEQVAEGVNPADAVKSAIAVGGINGALEFLPFYSAAKSIGMGSYAKKSIAKVITDNPELSKRAIGLAKEIGGRAAKGAAVGAGAEGITEGLQELVSIAGLRWAENEPLFADLTTEDWGRIKNSAAAGALVGGVAMGAGATVGGPQAQDTAPPPAGTPPVQAGTPPVTPPTSQTRTQNLEAMRSRIDAALAEAQAAGNTAGVEELQQIRARFDSELGVRTPVQETPVQVPPVQEAPVETPPVGVPPVIQTIPPTQEVTPPVRETPLDIPPAPPVTQQAPVVNPQVPPVTQPPVPSRPGETAQSNSQSFNDILRQDEERLAQLAQQEPTAEPNAAVKNLLQIIKDEEEMLSKLGQQQETVAPTQEVALQQETNEPAAPVNPWTASELEFDAVANPSVDLAAKWGQEVADAISNASMTDVIGTDWWDSVVAKAKPQPDGELMKLLKAAEDIPEELGGEVAKRLVDDKGFSPNLVESLVKMAPEGWKLSDISKLVGQDAIPTWTNKDGIGNISLSQKQFVWWNNAGDAEIFNNYEKLTNFLNTQKTPKPAAPVPSGFSLNPSGLKGLLQKDKFKEYSNDTKVYTDDLGETVLLMDEKNGLFGYYGKNPKTGEISKINFNSYNELNDFLNTPKTNQLFNNPAIGEAVQNGKSVTDLTKIAEAFNITAGIPQWEMEYSPTEGMKIKSVKDTNGGPQWKLIWDSDFDSLKFNQIINGKVIDNELSQMMSLSEQDVNNLQNVDPWILAELKADIDFGNTDTELKNKWGTDIAATAMEYKNDTKSINALIKELAASPFFDINTGKLASPSLGSLEAFAKDGIFPTEFGGTIAQQLVEQDGYSPNTVENWAYLAPPGWELSGIFDAPGIVYPYYTNPNTTGLILLKHDKFTLIDNGTTKEYNTYQELLDAVSPPANNFVPPTEDQINALRTLVLMNGLTPDIKSKFANLAPPGWSLSSFAGLLGSIGGNNWFIVTYTNSAGSEFKISDSDYQLVSSTGVWESYNTYAEILSILGIIPQQDTFVPPSETVINVYKGLVVQNGFNQQNIDAFKTLAPPGFELTVTDSAGPVYLAMYENATTGEVFQIGSAGYFYATDDTSPVILYDTYAELLNAINGSAPPQNNSGGPGSNHSSSSTTPSTPPPVLPGAWAPADMPNGYSTGGYSSLIQTPEGAKITLNFVPTTEDTVEIAYIHNYLKHAPIPFAEKLKLFKEFPDTKDKLTAFKANHPYLIRKVSIDETNSLPQAQELLNDILIRRDKYTFDEILNESIKFKEKFGDEEFIAALANAPKENTIGATISPAPHLDGWLQNMRAEEELLSENPFEGVWADYEVNSGPDDQASRYGVIIVNPKTGKVLLRQVANQYEGITWDFARGGADRFSTPNAKPNLIDTNALGGNQVSPNKRYMEHPLVAAKREAREEFGYDVKIIGQLAKGFYTSDGKMASLYYVGVPVSEQTNEHLFPTHGIKETDDTRWVDLNEARRLVLTEPTLGLDSQMKRDGRHMPRLARIGRTLEAVYNPAMQKSDLDYRSSSKAMEKYFKDKIFNEFPNVLPAAAANKDFNDLTELQKMQVAAALYVSKRFPFSDSATKASLQKELFKTRKASLQDWLDKRIGSNSVSNILAGDVSVNVIQNKLVQTGGKIVLSLWHGTNKTREALIDDVINPVYFGMGWGGHDTKEGMYLTDTKSKAASWGSMSQVNMLVAFEKLKVIPGTTNYDSTNFTNMLQTAKNEGYDGLLFDNVSDSIQGRQVVVWNMENITAAGGMGVGFTGKNLYQSKGELKERMDLGTAKVLLDETFGPLAQKMLDSGLLEIVESGGPDGIAGQYFGEEQKIRVYLDYISSPRELIGAVLHEGAHAGMQEILGKSAGAYYKEFLNLNKPTVKNSIYKTAWEGAQRFGIENSLTPGNAAEINRVRNELNKIDPNFLIEEDLANFVQQADRSSTLWRRIFNAIKVWWAQSAIGKALKERGMGFELTEEMAVGLVTAVLRSQSTRRGKDYSTYVAHVTGQNWPAVANYPHGKPSLKYVLAGAGEGYIVFGWGFYALESQGALNYYKTNVGNKSYGMYLPDDIPPRLIEWDRSLSQQSSTVRDAITSSRDNYLLLRMAVKSKGRQTEYPGSAITQLETYGTGGALYNELVDYFVKTQFNGQPNGYAFDIETNKTQRNKNMARRFASRKLADYGLAGLRLLDAGSREIFVTKQSDGKYKVIQGVGSSTNTQVLSEAEFEKHVGPDLAAAAKTQAVGVTKVHAGFGYYNWVFWRQTDLDRFQIVYKNGNQISPNPTKNAAYDPNGIGIPFAENPGFGNYVVNPKTGQLTGSFSKAQQTIEVELEDLRANIDSVMGEGWLQKAEAAGLVEVVNEPGPNGESGSWAGNKIRLYAGSMPAGGSPAGVLLHEGKHATFKDVLGKTLKSYVNDLRTLANNGNQAARDAIIHATVAAADLLGIKHGFNEGGTRADLDAVRAAIEERYPGLLAEEELAYFTQYGTDTQSGVGFLKRLINQIKAWFAQTQLGKALKEAGLGFELTEGMAVEWAKMGLHKSLEKVRQSEQVKAQVLYKAAYMPPSTRLGKALEATESSDTFYSMGIQEFKDTLWTDPTDSRQDFVNKPGLLQKFRANFIDFFAEMEKKSTRVYDAYSLLRNKKAARLVQARQEYMFPLRDLIAKGPWTSKEVGDMLAARHLKVDNVNTRLAERSSYSYTKELLKALPESKKKELMKARSNVKGGKMPDGSVYLDANGTPARMAKRTKQKLMFDLMNKYVVFEQLNPDGKQALRFEWEVFKDAAGGFSNGGIGKGIVRSIDDVLAGTSKDQAQFDKIANLFDAMNRHALQIREDGELITPEEHARLLLDKTAYAPLRRESYNVDREIEQLFQRAGQGGSKQLGVRTGTTALSEPTLVLQNALAALEASAAAAERNLANKELYEVINADKEGWKPWFAIVDADKYMTHDEDGFLQERNATASNRADITLINKGKKLVIRPNMHNERAMGFVRAANNLDAQIVSGPMSVLNFFNNIVRWVNVTASPAFLMMNAIRDPGTALYNLQATEAAPYTSEIFANYGKSFKALKKVFLDGNRDPTDADVKMVEAFENAGGRTSFIEQLNPSDDTWRSFDAQVARRQGSMKQIMAAKDKWIDGLENFNVLFENVMRLSAFNVLIDKGVSKTRAARIAQDLTTNFTRRGYKTQALGNWWVFFNAAVQGNYQVLRNMLASKKLQAWAGGTIMFALMLDLLGRAVADDWDEIPEWDKERFIILPVKVAGDFVKIPAPWVYNVLWRAGGMFGETLAGVRKPQNMVLDLAALSAVTFNPLGRPGSIAQAISPTAADPFVQILENKDFAGNPIGPEGFPGAGNKANSELLWSSTPKGYQSVARLVNEWTGGSAVESGVIDLRPGDYQLLAKFLTGSLGRFLSDATFGLKENLEKGIEGPKEIPVIKEFFSEPYNPMRSQTYHTNIAAVYGAHKLEKMYREGPERDLVKLQEVRQARGKDLRMYSQAQDVERQIKSLRVRIRTAENRKDDARVKELRGRMEDVQERFNAAYKQRVG